MTVKVMIECDKCGTKKDITDEYNTLLAFVKKMMLKLEPPPK